MDLPRLDLHSDSVLLTYLLEVWHIRGHQTFTITMPSRKFWRHDILLCRAYAVRPSVTLANCDHICNKKWKSANDRIGRCLGYLRVEADWGRGIL